MKRKLLTELLACGLSLASFGAESLELGFLSPKQLKSPNADVNGVRLGLIYTENRNVEGVDINIIANKKQNFKGLSIGSLYDRTEGNFEGAKLGWFFFPITFNSVGGNMTGVQLGLINMVEQNTKGVQLGAANFTNTGTGVQFGVFNKAEKIRGLQLGLVNMAENLEGLQIGLVNMADNSEIFEVLPLLNFNFRF
ncbi:MAG: LA_2272 family surface repeat-containing protein [Cetobacterium sp.]